MNKKEIYSKLKKREISLSEIKAIEKETKKYIAPLQARSKISLDLSLKNFVIARR